MPDVAISDFYSQRVVTIEPHPALLRLRLVEPADFLRSQLRHRTPITTREITQRMLGTGLKIGQSLIIP